MTSTEPTTFARILSELADAGRTEADGGIRHDHSVYELASQAYCDSPATDESPGARFLAGVARDVAEYVEAGTAPEYAVRELAEDGAHEIADSAVPIYTHERWATFVDLGAYNEDVTELAGDEVGTDLTSAAGVALYMIADRLVRALAEELAEALDEDADEDEDAGGMFTDLATGQAAYVTTDGAGRFHLTWSNGVEIGHGFDTFAEAEAAFLNRNA